MSVRTRFLTIYCLRHTRNQLRYKFIVKGIKLKRFYTFFAVSIVLTVFSGCNDMITLPKPVIEFEDDNFETPFDMLSPDLSATFARGEEAFMKVFTVEEGLGPIFNQAGCVSCHPGNGRGMPDLALIRFSSGHNLLSDMGGPQLQDKALPGVPYEMLPAGVDKSTRLPPPVFGVGLIENIPVETILSYADEDDADDDGISGRPHWVTAPISYRLRRLAVDWANNLEDSDARHPSRHWSSKLRRHSNKTWALPTIFYKRSLPTLVTPFLIQRLKDQRSWIL